MRTGWTGDRENPLLRARVHMTDVGELPIHDHLTAAGTILPRDLPKSFRPFHTRCFPSLRQRIDLSQNRKRPMIISCINAQPSPLPLRSDLSRIAYSPVS
jgi:hypothetical protein